MQSRRVPKELDYKILYRIAILCEQYDCHELVEPWLKSWTIDEDKGIIENGKEEWIYIDWAFGRDKLFDRRVERLVRILRVDSGGKLAVFAHRDFPIVMPDKLVGKLCPLYCSYVTTFADEKYVVQKE